MTKASGHFQSRSLCHASFYKICISLFKCFSLRFKYLLLGVGYDVGLLEAVVLFAVEHLEPYTEEQRKHSKRSKEEHRIGVVVLHRVVDTGIGCGEHLTDEDGEQAQAYVLNPEYQ